jgi:hypothetical protein
MRGSVGSKNGTRFNQLKLYYKNIFKFSLDKRNIGVPKQEFSVQIVFWLQTANVSTGFYLSQTSTGILSYDIYG